MSTLKANNIEHLDASSPSIELSVGGGVVVSGVSTFNNDVNFTAAGGLNVTDGDVGIGTDDPKAKLQVSSYGDHSKIRVESSGNGNRAGIEFYRESSAGLTKGGAGIWVESETGSSTGELRFGTANNAGLQSLTPKMLLDVDGNLGIGTDNPNRNLSVYDDSSAGVEIKSGTTGQSSVFFTDTDDTNIGMIGYFHTDDSMFFRINDGEKVRIDSSGNVGINSTAPERRLDVLETASQTVAQFQTTGQTKALTRYECVGDLPVFVGAARSDFNIEINGNDCMTINHSNQNVSLTGNIIFPDGKGINFGASQGGGASSDLLDDYEEGTFTPVYSNGFAPGGYSTQAGRYTKIGNIVHFQITLIANSGSVSGAHLRVGGLPFNATSTAPPYGGANFVYQTIANSSSQIPMCLIVNGTDDVYFYKVDGTFWNSNDGVGTVVNKEVRIIGSYTV